MLGSAGRSALDAIVEHGMADSSVCLPVCTLSCIADKHDFDIYYVVSIHLLEPRCIIRSMEAL